MESALRNLSENESKIIRWNRMKKCSTISDVTILVTLNFRTRAECMAWARQNNLPDLVERFSK